MGSGRSRAGPATPRTRPDGSCMTSGASPTRPPRSHMTSGAPPMGPKGAWMASVTASTGTTASRTRLRGSPLIPTGHAQGRPRSAEQRPVWPQPTWPSERIDAARDRRPAAVPKAGGLKTRPTLNPTHPRPRSPIRRAFNPPYALRPRNTTLTRVSGFSSGFSCRTDLNPPHAL